MTATTDNFKDSAKPAPKSEAERIIAATNLNRLEDTRTSYESTVSGLKDKFWSEKLELAQKATSGFIGGTLQATVSLIPDQNLQKLLQPTLMLTKLISGTAGLLCKYADNTRNRGKFNGMIESIKGIKKQEELIATRDHTSSDKTLTKTLKEAAQNDQSAIFDTSTGKVIDVKGDVISDHGGGGKAESKSGIPTSIPGMLPA